MDMETEEGMKEYINNICKINGYIVNRDTTTYNDLVEGLVENKKNYGYQSCPCRLATGKKELDRDLMCPCDYAPEDIKEFGACYCNLYLRSDFYETVKADFLSVPERRPMEKEEAANEYLKSL
jgi:ferredoxin-thioredoxin reductase catalytic subunit